MAASKHQTRLEEGAARLLKEKDDKDWSPLQESNGIKVSYKALSPERYMATVEIDAAADDVFKACFDYTERIKWDKGFSAASKILEPGEPIDLVYQVVEGRLSVASRDFVNARYKKVLDDGFLVVHNAVEGHPERPPCVRGKHTDVGYIILKVGENKVRLFWFVQTELGGWLMMNLRSITGQNIADLLNNLRAYLTKK